MEAVLARQRSDRERHWEKTMGVPWGKFHRDLCHENQALWFANRFFLVICVGAVSRESKDVQSTNSKNQVMIGW